MLPIMLQLYNVREELFKDFDGALAEVAGMGYEFVELALGQAFGKSSGEFKTALDKAGLKAISAHVPYQDMVKDPEKAIGFHIDLGCKYIAIPYLGENERSTSTNYAEVKKKIARLGEEVKKRGGILLYHNHEFEFVDYNGKYALDDLYDSIPSSLLQTQIDTCWAKVGGADPAEYILKYTGRAPIVHLKDFDSSEGGSIKAEYELIGQAKKAREAGKFPFTSLGKGIQDIPGIIKAAEKAGTEWLVVEQDLPSPGKTAMEDAKESLDYLNSL